MNYEFHIDHTVPMRIEGYIWVFGSNLGGRHGRGAAKIAHKNFAAPYGQHTGRMGAAYGIPTKDRRLQPLPMADMAVYVNEFLAYARSHPQMRFYVTRVGCGLAGYEDENMAFLFRGAPENCNFAEEWKPYL